jgi:LPS-assembly protein
MELSAARLEVRTVIGQSYRLTNEPRSFRSGTGLVRSLSDIVGRVTVRYSSLPGVTERFRVDKDNLAIRRNEVDANDRRARPI